jgi:hexosaminidase
MYKIKIAITFIIIMAAYHSSAQSSNDKIPIIPAPKKMDLGIGFFKINTSSLLVYNDGKIAGDLETFNIYLDKNYGFQLKTEKSSRPKSGQINIYLSSDLDSERYQLTIDSNGVFITAGTVGIFYGLQTLLQLFIPDKKNELPVPYLRIDDSPRFRYRGMHLDVSRHFFTVDAVKRYIDILALYKYNYFHWHLTDDQGWRIEIKKYPKLQSIAAWRSGTLIGHAGDKPEIYDSTRYGGYYTQEQIRDVIKYASQRHITIIPEIEMPGHATAALAAYPEFSCTGGPIETAKSWGIFKDVYCPTEETFTFLQNILDEVCELFPGKYIHIGGDECPIYRWKESPYCQELIKRENLGDEHGIQKYFTNRIAGYLKTKNKITIGWDEILEDDLDSNAIIMSWRGYNGGVAAATKNHDAIMSPYTHCYFDMYQSRFTSGRMAIGGYLPLDIVYRFEPVPDVLNMEQAKHILGAQGNVWTEYIADEDRLQEMIFPRIAALSEVLWTPVEKKDFAGFSSRVVTQFKFWKFLNLKYSTALFDISSRVFPNGDDGISIELFSSYPKGKIYYTTNGTTPDLNSKAYSGKIDINQSTVITAALYEDTRRLASNFSQIFNLNLATGKEVLLANPPHAEYSRGGGFSLVNGVIGNLPWIPSEWLGFSGTDLDATIDLGSTLSISRVTIDVLKDELGKIYLPKEVSVSVSTDGKVYKLIKTIDAASIDYMQRKLRLEFERTDARWVKVVAKNSHEKDWLFVDEISVE